jgi:hypothetical protein
MRTLAYVLKKFNPISVESPIRLKFKRDDMAGLFKELGFKVGAEIGVYQGHYSEVLCQKNPNLKLYCIDPWEVYETKVVDPNSTDEKLAHDNFEATKKRLSPYNCKIIKNTSMEAIKEFKPNSLDFVYIDANHDREHVLEDIESWSKIVRDGGIVSGHDYGHYKDKTRNLESKKVIDDYVEKNHKILFLVNRNYQTSWFFVK